MKKKSILTLCILFVMICTLGLTACNGSYAMIDLIVDFQQIENEYEVDDVVDLSKLSISAKFNDDTVETIPLDKVTVFLDGKKIGLDEVSKITETVGTKILEIKYSDFVKSIQITVKEKYVPTLTGVEMNATNVTKSYAIGDEVSLDGLKIYAVYDNGSLKKEVDLTDENVTIFMDEEIVTRNYSRITEEIGTKNIKVKYTVFNTENTFAITVNDVKDRVVISLPENFKTTYKVGDSINVTGITAQAEYRSGRKENIDEIKYYIGTEEANFSALTETKGSKTIVAKAVSGELSGEKEITFTVENYVNAISLDTEGAILTFTTDDELSIETFSAVKINVSYADSQDNTQLDLTATGVACLNVTEEAIIFSDLTNTAGDKVITVTYKGKTESFTVKVTDGETALKEMTITPPTKTAYTAGETGVTLAGLAITAQYKDEYGKEDKVINVANFAENDVKIYFKDKLVTDYDDLTKITTPGENQVFSVDVRYEGKTASFNITVTNEVVSLNANVTNAKTTYEIEEDVDFSGLVVTATLTYGSKTVENSNLSFFDGETPVTNLNTLTTAVVENKVVTVSFGGQSASFTIHVNDVLLSISFGTQTTFTTYVNTAPGSVYLFDDLKVYGEYKSGAHALIESGYTFSNNSITVPTSGKTVTVTYEGKEGEVNLVVVNYLASLSVNDIPTLVQGINVFQKLKKITVLGTYAYGSGETSLPLLQESGDAFLYDTVYFALKTDENTYTEYTQLELDDIANIPGTYTLRLEYVFNSRSTYCEFEIEVATASSGINEFSKPKSIVLYEETLAKARKEEKTGNEFEGAFFSNDEEEYLVGDDNPFKFVPILSQPNLLTEEITTLDYYRTDSKVYCNNTELTSSKSGNSKSFYLNGQLMVVADVTQNTYDFTEDAIGKSFTLSVLPSHEQFDFNDGEFEPIEWTIKITDGFNISDPRELCLLEQSNRGFWTDIKKELGLLTTSPAAIILHQNTMITKDSIPDLFYYTLSDNFDLKYTYTNAQNQTITCAPENVPAEYGGGNLGRTFLLDEEYALFEYNMQNGRSFTIHGNFFDIDLSSLPLVAAFEQSEFNPHDEKNQARYNKITTYYGSDLGTYYGQFMSKVSFLEVHGVEGTFDSADETFNFSNFAVKGNANINQLLVANTDSITNGKDNPVFGGGIIFVKTKYCKANIENIHAHACFIPFYSRNETIVSYTNVKAYDSFLNGLFVNSDSVNTLTNCHMKRAGGPLILLVQGSKDGENNTKIPLIPIVHASSDCVLENYITGGEQWFSINMAPVSAVDSAAVSTLKNFGKTIKKDGKYNLIALSILSGGDMTASTTQAYMEYGNAKLDRLLTDPVFYPTTLASMGALVEMGSSVPSTFNVNDHVICSYNDTVLTIAPTYDSMDAIFTEDKDHNPVFKEEYAELYSDYSGNTYKYVAINVGGMGLLTELFPAS